MKSVEVGLGYRKLGWVTGNGRTIRGEGIDDPRAGESAGASARRAVGLFLLWRCPTCPARRAPATGPADLRAGLRCQAPIWGPGQFIGSGVWPTSDSRLPPPINRATRPVAPW